MPVQSAFRPGQPPAGALSGRFDLSWELFGELCRALAVRVAHEYRPELVIGLTTAGVVPAATIATMLQCDFESMKVTRRENGRVVHAYPRVLSPTPVSARGRRVLIVDELSTSGETLRLALAAVREVGPAAVRTAASFVRPGGYRPDYFALETGSLIVFPWDRQVIDDGGLVPGAMYTPPG
jgi:hypoxanthine phosphoribosyltransferase